ncbi:MAG: HAMP domain-containing histidine kinase [Proteobacteria bacterium]|nr:HAMP domain-containing histidine kinase [Pseudomonadota bacterium]
MRDSFPSKFRLRDRLSYKQAKAAVAIAVVLGMMFSFFQIYLDFYRQEESLESTVSQVLNIIEQSASQAAYSLDREYATELISGLFEYKPIYEASIKSDVGDILSKIQGSRDDGWLRPLTDSIFGQSREYNIKLKILPPPVSFAEMGKVVQVGELTVKVDTYPIGVEFIRRSLIVFFTGMFRNLILSFMLLIFFHYFLTKPFIAIEEELLRVDPRYPERVRLGIPKGHKRDEFARMVIATNRLLVTIQQNVKERVSRISDSERMRGELAERKRRETELEAVKSQLERANKELTDAMVDLKMTQSRLIQSERMAALGEVTASLAHEINTPLGLGVSGASHLTDELNKFKKLYKAKEIPKSEFEDFLNVGIDISELIISNLRKSYHLVKSFKQVAVDQVSETKRLFKVKEYTEQVLMSMGNIISKSGHVITIDCEDSLEINGYAGAYSQLITNLILNSIMHGFDKGVSGNINLKFTKQSEMILFIFSDDGRGIPEDIQSKIYEPFYTTKPNEGGTGLGMHIIYKVVTEQFNGSIDCVSETSKGTTFYIELAENRPD